MIAERLRLVAYQPTFAPRWDAFVREAKNGALLFERGFMDYHADRFPDASLLAFEGDDESNLVAVLPATLQHRAEERWLASHAGLTFGGFLSDARMTTSAMLALFAKLKAWGLEQGLVGLAYKPAPACYHRLPADEDLYALYRAGATVVRCDVNSVIDLADAPSWSKGRRHSLSKARAAGIDVAPSEDFAGLVALLHEVLARHGATPVHSEAELRLLARRFPDRVRLFAARRGAEPVAYLLLFDSGRTVHVQYMASNEAGRTNGGLEAIVEHLQTREYADRRYLSFGISTEAGGQVLNEGLIAQKEMFGGRPLVQLAYDLRFS